MPNSTTQSMVLSTASSVSSSGSCTTSAMDRPNKSLLGLQGSRLARPSNIPANKLAKRKDGNEKEQQGEKVPTFGDGIGDAPKQQGQTENSPKLTVRYQVVIFSHPLAWRLPKNYIEQRQENNPKYYNL